MLLCAVNTLFLFNYIRDHCGPLLEQTLLFRPNLRPQQCNCTSL